MLCIYQNSAYLSASYSFPTQTVIFVSKYSNPATEILLLNKPPILSFQLLIRIHHRESKFPDQFGHNEGNFHQAGIPPNAISKPDPNYAIKNQRRSPIQDL